MAMPTEDNAALFTNIATAVPLNCDFPLYEDEEVEVIYGRQALKAVLNTDYTVVLNPLTEYVDFLIVPTAALLTKINDLIANPPTDEPETNFVVVRRVLDYLTSSTPQVVRDTTFLSREIDRMHMKLIQLAEEVRRAVVVPPNNVGTTVTRYFIDVPANGRTIIWDDTLGRFVAGPTSTNIEDAQQYADDAEAARDAILNNPGFIAVADDLLNADTIGIVAANLTGSNTIGTVATSIANVNSVGNNMAAVLTTAANITAVGTVHTNTAAINTVSTNIAAVLNNSANMTAINNLNSNMTEITTVYTNIAAVVNASDNMAAIIDAPTQAANAAASAAAAAASAAEGLYNEVITITNANSPFTPTALQEGYLFRCDTSGGAIVVNLSSLATYNEDMKFGFVKDSADGNTITINRGGTDTISGNTSVALSTRYETHVIVGDLQSGVWIDTVQTTGIADNQVTNAKLADMAANTVKVRNNAASGDPVDLAMGTNTILARIAGNIVAATMSQIMDIVNSTRGTVLYRGAASWLGLTPGTAGRVLTTNGAGADPSWTTLPDGIPVGTTIEYNGTTLPTGYLAEDGAAVSRTTYAALFTAIGTTHGAGDGSTTFNVPDSRRRTAVGSGGTGTGTLGNAVGNKGGAETHSLVANENGAHTHTLDCRGAGGLNDNTNGSVQGISTRTTSSSGLGTAHNNLQPSIVKMKCIKF